MAADPTAHFDALTAEALRAAGSLKWSRHDPPALGAWVAEMDFGTAPEVTRALHEAVDAARFGYLTPGAAEAMARACARWYAERYRWEVPARWISPLADVVAGLRAAIDHFTPPGSPVVLPTPAYMPFLTLPGLLGRPLLQVPLLSGDDGRYRYDLEGIARAFAAGGTLLVHTNPHNPLGRVFTAAEQRALAEVVEDAGARVFADEIHAPLVYPGAQHVPYASLSPATAAHTITATSASKAWNLPGLKTAQLILSNEEDARRWAEVAFLFGHGASTPGVLAATVAYTEGGPWLADVLAYLDGNRRRLGELLAERLPAVRWTPPEGTYLAWLDCRDLALPTSAGAFFLEAAGVGLVDGPECGAPGGGHVRLNLATPRPVLEDIVTRMAAAVARGR
ncbi:MalY/PatB family protein [Geodermatophilus sp. SYSU D00758]